MTTVWEVSQRVMRLMRFFLSAILFFASLALGAEEKLWCGVIYFSSPGPSIGVKGPEKTAPLRDFGWPLELEDGDRRYQVLLNDSLDNYLQLRIRDKKTLTKTEFDGHVNWKHFQGLSVPIPDTKMEGNKVNTARISCTRLN